MTVNRRRHVASAPDTSLGSPPIRNTVPRESIEAEAALREQGLELWGVHGVNQMLLPLDNNINPAGYLIRSQGVIA